MTTPLFTLGPVVFRPGGINVDEHDSGESWRHRFHDAIEGRGRRGFHGRDDTLRTFTGVFFPRQYGAEDGPNRLREIANSGESWQLIDGSGNILGRFVILSIEQTHSTLLQDGTGRQVRYRLTLREDSNVKTAADRARAATPNDRFRPVTDLVS